MDLGMHGRRETTILPRVVLNVLHMLVMVGMYCILFNDYRMTGGITLPGYLHCGEGNIIRKMMIFSCALIYFLRVIITSMILLKRRMEWNEVFFIIVWITLVHFSFALLGGSSTQPISLLDIIAIILFIFGSYLNTYSEYQRKKFKENKKNEGKLYTGGLFRYSMHINYFGDFLLFSGYATLARFHVVAYFIPCLMFLLFTFFNIPDLDRYLANRYPREFALYAASTSKFIPYFY